VILVKTCAWYVLAITLSALLFNIKNKKATELLSEIVVNLPILYLAYFVIKL
jgi:hypothetical protein